MMSKSRIDGNINHFGLTTSESKKVTNHLLNNNSLFSEIMKNHSGQNTPVLLDQVKFDVKDVPLPGECLSKHYPCIVNKPEKSRKRYNDCKDEMVHKKKRPYTIKNEPQKHTTEIRTENIRSKIPKLCEARTHIRQNSTWGERSVKAFKILTEVGEGTYGHVFKAIDRQTNTIKALKKVRLENEREGFPITTVREIKILQQLNHINIVKLHEVVTDYDLNDSLMKERSAKDKGFYLVFEYMDHDLYGILDSGISLSELQIASITKQILEGINYSHKKMFLHRDIKCSNILINNRGEVKIADYGLSRRFNSDNTALRRPYTNKVITLWYRAPELLLGEEYYGTSIDMWSIGCIMGELFTHRTMFMANTEMEQLDVISRVCGTPSPATWPNVVKLPLYQTYRPKYMNKRRLREYYFTVPNSALDVLDWLLQLDPKRRCTADQALRSFWLNKIDPQKIPPPQFPTDGDYHELSCKRRHKENRSDTGYKSSKSSPKPQKTSSSSSNLSEKVLPTINVKAEPEFPDTSITSFQLPDDMLSVLGNHEALKQILQSAGHTDLQQCLESGTSINDALERLLEPYIKQMLLSSTGTLTDPGHTNAQSTHSRASSVHSATAAQSDSHKFSYDSIFSPLNNLSEKHL